MISIAMSVTPNKTKFGPLLFPGELERAFRCAGELGYDGVEISLREPLLSEVDAIKQLSDENGIRVLSVATGQSYVEDGFSLYNGDQVLREKAVERIKGHIEFASNFDAAVIIGGVRGTIVRNEFRKSYLELGRAAVDACIEEAAKFGVTLLLEPVNRYETNIFNRVEEACSFIEKYSYQGTMKVLPDAFHMNIEETDILKTIDTFLPYFGAFHCGDSNRLAPGMGHLDFSLLVDHLKGGSLMYLGVEVLPLPDSETAAQQAVKTLREASRASVK